MMNRLISVALVLATTASTAAAQGPNAAGALQGAKPNDAVEAAWLHVRRLAPGACLEVTVIGREPQQVSFVAADDGGLTIRHDSATETVPDRTCAKFVVRSKGKARAWPHWAEPAEVSYLVENSPPEAAVRGVGWRSSFRSGWGSLLTTVRDASDPRSCTVRRSSIGCSSSH